jgi:apolipoprotein N-acyltransferase
MKRESFALSAPKKAGVMALSFADLYKTSGMSKTYRLLLTAFFLIGSLFSGIRMYQLKEQEELWGFLPLWFFLFLFGLRTAWGLGKRYLEMPRRWRWLGMATLSGVFLWLGFPPSPLSPFLFIGFVPLLIMEREMSEAYTEKAGKRFFSLAYHGIVLWNILATFWVANSALAAGLFAITVNSLIMCLPLLLYHHSRKVMNVGLSGLALISFWISFEYLHLRWDLSWPWLTLGNGFAAHPAWVQWYEYTGVFGGSLWVLLVNWMIFRWWETRQSEEYIKARQKLIWIGAVLVIPIAASLIRYYTYQETGQARTVAVVQPNFEPHYEKDLTPKKAQLQRFLRLSEEVVDENTDYLVYPETIFGLIENRNLGKGKYTAPLKRFVDQHPGLKLIAGFSTYDRLDPMEPPLPKTVRVDLINNGKDTLYWQVYNAAVQLTAGEEEVPVYFKSKLVPGAEQFPFYEILFVLKFVVDQLDGTIEGNATQEKREAFKAEDGMGVGPVICYESIYGEFATGYIKEGANALFILTNDGWWDKTAGHKQHLQFASLRAIETRRPIARSANTGISCFINQRGDIRMKTGYEETATIKDEMLFSKEITFYVRWGDLIGRLALFTGILLLLNTFSKAIIRKKNS